MRIVRGAGWALLLVWLAGTACRAPVSDTGYVGTWSRRGTNVTTTLSIVEDGDGYRFRWGRESDDGKLVVRCDWEGYCEEQFDGERLGTYRMRAWVDEETGLLRVEGRGTLLRPDGQEVDVRYVDELRVVRDGTRLVSRVIENNGNRLEGRARGKRVFEKTSDEVVDPPRDEGGRG